MSRWVTPNCSYRVKTLSSNTCTAGPLIVARVRSSNPKIPQTKKNFPLSSHSSPPIGLCHTRPENLNPLFTFFWLLQSNLSDRFNEAVRGKTLKEKKTIRTSSEPEFCLICRRGRVGIFVSLYKNPSWTSTSLTQLEKLVCFFFFV